MEIISASCVPDAIEAMIELRRLEEAEPFVDMLEGEGRRLDRPWQLAVGARCRDMLLAAHGDINAASVATQRALAEHRRLPMPFRTRTDTAAARADPASSTTEDRVHDPAGGAAHIRRTEHPAMGKPRICFARPHEYPSESQRRAQPDRAARRRTGATGMTNRDVAAVLSMSLKTVEANLRLTSLASITNSIHVRG
jgi:hypothetical protein